MIGKIHSLESFGTVDGPGIRLVVFFQGCPMRCQYCHNPDTWTLDSGKEITVEEIIKEFERNRGFYNDGGITATGGEPLMQIDFLIELFTVAKSRNIHTCLDTSGITFNPNNQQNIDKFNALLDVTDLIMLDIKHINSVEHEKLTKQKNDNILAFCRYLDEKNMPLWIRHVVIPGITFEENHLIELGRFLGTLENLKALDVLPYHTMGENKYLELNMTYPLAGVPALSKDDAIKAKSMIMQGIRETRNAAKK